MAAVIAILIGLCPKFGALVYAIPQGVIGGITVILYGMIGLLGAKIWVENQVNFADPLVLVPIAAGLIAGIGNVSLVFTDGFQISGIALGTIVILAGYHLLHALAPRSKTHAAPSPVLLPVRCRGRKSRTGRCAGLAGMVVRAGKSPARTSTAVGNLRDTIPAPGRFPRRREWSGITGVPVEGSSPTNALAPVLSCAVDSPAGPGRNRSSRAPGSSPFSAVRVSADAGTETDPHIFDGARNRSAPWFPRC